MEIRRHPVLGPVFNDRIGSGDSTWRKHEDKIAGFWRNAILHERSYDGRPQKVHMSVPAIQPGHFPIWLDLFERVAKQTLPEHASGPWIAFARRIGDGMLAGVALARQPAGSVPTLR